MIESPTANGSAVSNIFCYSTLPKIAHFIGIGLACRQIANFFQWNAQKMERMRELRILGRVRDSDNRTPDATNPEHKQAFDALVNG